MSVPEGFSITSSPAMAPATADDWQKNATAWTCTVKNPRGKTFTRKFYMGPGHNGRKPTVMDFMSCIASDAASIDNSRSFEEWASDLGYEIEVPSDRRRAYKIYEQCVTINERMKDFLTDEERDAFLAY